MKRFLLFFLFLVSCEISTSDYHILKIYSPNKTQCITIFTGNKLRYIVAGNYNVIPDTNYVKLNARYLDLIGDVYYGCWNKEGYAWIIYSYSGELIESKLDSSVYKFDVKFPQNDSLGNGCFDFNYFDLYKEKIGSRKNIIFEVNQK